MLERLILNGSKLGGGLCRKGHSDQVIERLSEVVLMNWNCKATDGRGDL